MVLAHLHIHHTSTPTGEYLRIDCPHCAEGIGFIARLLPDNDMVVLEYGEEEELSIESSG